MKLFTRSIRPSDVTPNPNDPVTAAPGTVGPPSAVPGDPNGVTVESPDNPGWWPPAIRPSAWSGWPAEWGTPNWSGHHQTLSDTAWLCLDLNASVLSTMPPYLIDPSPNLNADWLRNPNEDTYASWEEFAKTLFWDYQAAGEAFVIADARYATGYPARFHVVPGWTVEVDFDAMGRRTYAVGEIDVTADMLHIRYTSSVDTPRGIGPLEVGAGRVLAAEVLQRYGTTLATNGGIPASILEHPDELSAEQSLNLQQQWVAARMSSLGEPAVLSGGVTWQATQLNPTEMALIDLLQWNEARIAVLLGVPPFLVGLPSGGDSLTYANASSLFDYHWRSGLRPKAHAVTSALSGWLLPRGTELELNRDAYVQPDQSVRAQTYQILNAIVDAQGNPVMTVQEIRDAERIDNSAPDLAKGVLRG